MERQFNHTSPATAVARETNAANGGVDVAAKVYRGDGIEIKDFPHLKRHETLEVRSCRVIVTGGIVMDFELREG